MLVTKLASKKQPQPLETAVGAAVQLLGDHDGDVVVVIAALSTSCCATCDSGGGVADGAAGSNLSTPRFSISVSDVYM